jgi:PAS domain S-box-containing protein
VSGPVVRVLVVDDYAPGLYARATLLRRAGFEVFEARNGVEALQQAAAGRPQVVVLDVALPMINGYEVCRRVKADPALPGVQVLHVTSAHRDTADHARGLEAGADGYLIDPVPPEVLLATVRSLARAGAAEVAAGAGARQWQLTVDSISEAVCLLDHEGRILRHNAVLARLSGQGPDLVGRDARDVLEAILTGAGWERDIGLTEAPQTVELEAGEKVWQLWTETVRESDGLPAGIVCVLRDISERRRIDAMRAALLHLEQEARREAEATNHAKDEFLAVLSHELRTPLTAMLGWTSMLASGRLNAEATAHAIEVVDRNTRLQARIIEDLLDVSRIISGKMTLRLEDVSLGPALEAAVDSMRAVAAARGVALEIRLEAGIGILSGDAGRLQQVFANLLSNAVKFTPAGGRIVVTATRNAESIVVAVSDTGRGIPTDLLPFIFEPFRQAEGAQRRTHTGLGLGLAIVRHVVELHGGRVHVASEGPGQGATFSVHLPVGTCPVEVEAPPTREDGRCVAAPASLRGLRLLLVEDDPDTREVVGTLLGQAGVEVMTVGSAEAALAAIGSSPLDVLISDVGMAGRDGYDLIREVRRMPSDRGRIPAIALSAFARESDRQAALAAGYDRHVAKPVEVERLLAAVADVIGVRSR